MCTQALTEDVNNKTSLERWCHQIFITVQVFVFGRFHTDSVFAGVCVYDMIYDDEYVCFVVNSCHFCVL